MVEYSILSLDLSDVVTEGKGALFSNFIERYGNELARKILVKCFTSKGPLASARNDMFRGKLSEADFFSRIATAVNDERVKAEELQEIFSATVRRPIKETMTLLRRIVGQNGKPRPMIFVVADHVEEEKEGILNIPGLRELVDGYIWSFQLHLCKKDKPPYTSWGKGFFDEMKRLLAVDTECDEEHMDPKTIIYVDHLTENVIAANRAGFTARLFRGANGLERWLKSLGFEFTP